MKDDDIEILDIFDNNKKVDEPAITRVSRLEKQEEPAKVQAEKLSKKSVKKRKVKASAFQKLFCLVSALFLLGCIGYYGYRLVKYYRIYNPKVDSNDGSVLLAKDIVGKSEFATDNEDGLFSSSGNYIYKGDIKNNY